MPTGSLDRALAAAVAERTPDAAPGGFAIVALGKLGGRELNYSSDVDLLFLYDPETLPRKAREEPEQAALRIGQRVTEILQKRTEDGYAFRVDLRLRPSPEVTPIVLPVDAAISYYESSALPWERAAFIRARAAAGDPALGRYFLEAIHPFVWRRSLDFGAIGEIRSISRRIRDHYAQGQAFGPGYDVKRGRGGIREVEFFAQIHQLIHGGREPALRAPATLDALAALAKAGRIGAGRRGRRCAERLSAAAHDRAPAADGRRPPDPQPARRRRPRSTMSRGCTGSTTARPCSACCGRMSSGSRRSTTRSPPAESERLPENGAALERGAGRGRLRRAGGGARADRGLALGQGALAAHQRGARAVRGDAAGADRGVRRRARSDAAR